MNAIMDKELDQLCGKGANGRNGHRAFETYVGALNSRTPQAQDGKLLPGERLRVMFT